MLEAVTADESGATPDDALAARELLQRLLGELKPDDRIVIQMLDLEQKSIAEISALTGWNQFARQSPGLSGKKEVAETLYRAKREERRNH